mmetsp:Transcript_26474/g.29692  ORF Transcript_26474/g.29692 Transcript_26474/m.29692 type:complete len:430 (+) Transcript_26474:44-1333(+)
MLSIWRYRQEKVKNPDRNALSSFGLIVLAYMLVSWPSFREYDDVKIFPVSAFQPQQIITTTSSSLSTNRQYNKFFRHGIPEPIRITTTTATDEQYLTRFLMSLLDNEQETSSSSSSLSFAIDPTSETAKRIVSEKLQLSSEQYQQLAELAVLVNDWNSHVNLISRKDCSRDVIFGRHILPSLAPLAILNNDDNNDSPLTLSAGQRVCDVGTGGGFPGIPLAIARPDVDFLLIDSVGKKIKVVQDIADQLGLNNVKTYHGRAESVSGEDSGSGEKFSWVVGRSVSSIPTFAFWVHHLLQKNNGRLVYLTGGDIDETVADQAVIDEEIENLLDVPGVSDKRVLVFPQQAVDKLAKSSGEKLRVPTRGGTGGASETGRSRLDSEDKNYATGHHRNRKRNGKKETAKGQWTKRNSSAKKQRGYDDFQRFDSLS